MLHSKDMNDHSDQQLKDSYAQNLSLLAVNNCSYSKPVSSSNASERIPIVNYIFNPSSYGAVNGSTVASVIINSGAYSVYGPNSTVSLTVKFQNVLDDKLAWAWGDSWNNANDAVPTAFTGKSGGSCANIFRQAIATSRGGTMCQQNLYANLYSATTLPFQGYGKELLMSGAGAASYSSDQFQAIATYSDSPGGYSFPVYSARCAVSFELPLSRLYHLFGQKAPLPPMFVSGMRLNLTFEQMQTAFCFFYATNAVTTGAPFSGPFVPVDPLTALGRDGLTPVVGAVASPNLAYDVNNMSLNLDVSQLWDSSTQILNHIASSLNSSGLQYTYQGLWSTQVNLVGDTQTIEIPISAAKIISVVARIRNTQLFSNKGCFDSMASLPLVKFGGSADSKSICIVSNQQVGTLGNSSFRLRIGSHLLSLTPITSGSVLFRNTTQALMTVKNGQEDDIDALRKSNKPYDTDVSYADYYYGAGCSNIAFDLQKSSYLNNSGLASNNSKSILFECQSLNVLTPVQCSLFVTYLQIANVTTENVIIDL
jgi:hypothetical protein